VAGRQPAQEPAGGQRPPGQQVRDRDQTARDQAPGDRAKAIGGMSHVFAMATGAMTDMIFTGVFERFPELQICWIETGVGWIPHFLEQMDDRYWRNRGWGQVELTHAPSDYWYRNMSATFITDRSGIELRNDDRPGFWESYGYHNYGDPWLEQRYAGD